MKLTLLGCLVVVLAGCHHFTPPVGHPSAHDKHDINTAQNASGDVTVQAYRPAISFYSSYLTAPSAARCNALNSNHPCKEDVIPADVFYTAIQQGNYFVELAPSNTYNDYEILIANQAATQSASLWQKFAGIFTRNSGLSEDKITHFTEISIQWRGIEIDSRLIELTVTDNDTQSPSQLAANILKNWLVTADKESVFSARFLFTSLRASNYFDDLQLPNEIGDFQSAEFQLYHDPFKGVISRYMHDDYESAVMDITVYPIVHDIEQSVVLLLKTESLKEVEEATLIADARNIDLHVDTPPAPFKAGDQTGYYVALSAIGSDGEPMYATSYIFKLKDKFVKFSATFPPRIANDLVLETLPKIRVPDESELMAELRQIARQNSPQS